MIVLFFWYFFFCFCFQEYTDEEEETEEDGEEETEEDGEEEQDECEEKQKTFIGVSLNSKSSNYLARLFCHGKVYHCGYFSNKLEAAKAVNAKCIKFGISLKNPEAGLPKNKPPQVRFISNKQKVKNNKVSK